MTSLGLRSTFDAITLDQNRHHLYSTSAGGKVLFNDTCIRVIGSMELLANLSEKLRAKFPFTSRGYSLAKIDHLDDAFSEVFEGEASPVNHCKR